MKRSYLRACFLLFSPALLLLASCAKEPPFTVVTGKAALEAAEPGFGFYVYRPEGMEDVQVHRRVYEVRNGKEPTERIVDIYYPSNFRFRNPARTVIGGTGRAEWTANVSWGEMIAASGLVAVVIDGMPDEGALYDQLLARVIEESDELFIDQERIAFWAEGHGAPLPLTAAFRGTLPTPPKAIVCVSPIMQIGDALFEFDAGPQEEPFPMLIATGEEDEFYEVNRSVELFDEFAGEQGIPVTRLVCPGADHNWMTLDDFGAGSEVDPEAVALIQEEIAFLKKQL